MTNYELLLELNNQVKKLGPPISISRPVKLSPVEMSGAFYLPEFGTSTFEYNDVFVGDVKRGGSCNVDIHTYCPHNLTHIEVSSHVVENGLTVDSLTADDLNGLAFVIDTQNKYHDNDKFLPTDYIKSKIESLQIKPELLIIKSKESSANIHTDYSGNDPISVEPKLSKIISSNFPFIRGLILDLPSIDAENDSGLLLSHRYFFEISESGSVNTLSPKKKFIVELSYLNKIQEGYYYVYLTPYKIQTNACITDIILRKVEI